MKRKTRPLARILSIRNRLTRRYRLFELRSDFIDEEIAVKKARGNGTCRTIAICNQKGGVGKTVTAINLSARLAAGGFRTLLIDLDPQGHSGLGLGLDIDSLEHSVYDVLLNGRYPIRDAIIPLRSNLEILPSNIDLASAELELARFKKRERRLKRVIEGLRESYDYIVIDCPPSAGILTVNALVASQIAIVPVTPSWLPIQSLSRATEVLMALKESLLLDITVFYLITLFDRRPKEARSRRENLEQTHGQHLLKTVVRNNTRLDTATRKGLPIFDYDRRCPGSQDYAALAEEIIALESGQDRGADRRILE